MNMRKILILVISVMLCCCMSGCYGSLLSDGESHKAAEDITETTEQEVNRDVSFAEIYKAFKSNPIVAEDTYNDKYFAVTAKINGMKTGGFMGLEGDVTTLTMETKVDNTIVFFLARFGEDQRESLSKVVVGDTISFVGKCNDGTFSDCVLE